ncbi:MAG: hypothetical protein WBV51_21845, partial [Pseudolabrys sp.]
MDARVKPGHDGYFVARNPDKQIPGGFRGFAIREIATPRSGIEIAVHAKAELPIVGVGNFGHTGRRPITQARTLCHGYVV